MANPGIKTCCDCKHFRMFKPKLEYCTILKIHVDPLVNDKKCYELRKGLKLINPKKETING